MRKVAVRGAKSNLLASLLFCTQHNAKQSNRIGQEEEMRKEHKADGVSTKNMKVSIGSPAKKT